MTGTVKWETIRSGLLEWMPSQSFWLKIETLYRPTPKGQGRFRYYVIDCRGKQNKLVSARVVSQMAKAKRVAVMEYRDIKKGKG